MSVARAVTESQRWIRFVNQINTKAGSAPRVLYCLALQYARAVAPNYPGFLEGAINQDHALGDPLEKFDPIRWIATARRARLRVVAFEFSS